MKKILLLMICNACLVYSCKETGGGKFNVTGKYKNADKLFLPKPDGKISEKVYLVEVPFGKDQNPVAIDSISLSEANSNFHLSGKGKKDGVYELVFGENLLNILLIDDADEIKIDADFARQDKDDSYEISGSGASKSMQIFFSNFGKKRAAIDKSFDAFDSLKKINASDSVLMAATVAKNSTMTELNNYSKEFLNSATNGTVIGLALGSAAIIFSQKQYEESLNLFAKKYPENDLLSRMKKKYDMQKAMAQLQAQQQSQQGLASSWIGQQAPELNLPDANGKIISLASFKGKYLLVDFWASWCGPCRNENPNVVKAYSEFKDRNFAILGVSLDKDKNAWQQAVKDDKLAWSQVSDLKEWGSKAVSTYQFQGIPFNVLIDPQGKIIGQELRGRDLEDKLKQLLQ